MPAPAVRRAADGQEGYAWGLSRIACAQILYAQAERCAETSASKSKGVGTQRGGPVRRGVTSVSEPVPASAVHTSESVADSLADIAIAFITHVGARAAARANLAGRTHVTFPDVLSTFQVIAPVAQTHTADLARYMRLAVVPFPAPVPDFPQAMSSLDHITSGDVTAWTSKDGSNAATTDGETATSGQNGAEANEGAAADEKSANPSNDSGLTQPVVPPWIEPWMPALPPSRTYVCTPGVVSSDSKQANRSVLSLQRRQAELSLTRLVQPESSETASGDQYFSQNPFLAPTRVNFDRVLDSEGPVGVREVLEPSDDLSDERDSNYDSKRDTGKQNRLAVGASGSTITEGNRDPKRARVQRIFAEAAGGGNTVVPSPAASPRSSDRPAMERDRTKEAARKKQDCGAASSAKPDEMDSEDRKDDAAALPQENARHSSADGDYMDD